MEGKHVVVEFSPPASSVARVDEGETERLVVGIWVEGWASCTVTRARRQTGRLPFSNCHDEELKRIYPRRPLVYI